MRVKIHTGESGVGFTIKTPFGWAAVICNDKGEAVRSFLPSSKQRAEEFIANLPRRSNNLIEKRFTGYFSGKKTEFAKIHVCIDGLSPFQKKVLQALKVIPYGTTTTYKQLAALAGNPRAVRAVGSAMARNPLPLIIPCHRVVRSDGTLGEFSADGGTELKRRMLAMEGVHSPQLPSSSRKG